MANNDKLSSNCHQDYHFTISALCTFPFLFCYLFSFPFIFLFVFYTQPNIMESFSVFMRARSEHLPLFDIGSDIKRKYKTDFHTFDIFSLYKLRWR